MSQPDSQPRAQPAPVVSQHPVLELLKVALPTVVTMTSYTLMQSVDKLMASRIGPDPIYVGAQGNGGLASWVPISIAMGFITVVNSFVSQNMGAGKPERGPAYVWNALWFCVAWALLLVPFAIVLPDLFRLMWDDPKAPDPRLNERVALSCGYAQPLLFGAFITMASRAFAQYFYGMHKASVVLVAGLLGNLTNFAFNSLLMYGDKAPTTNIPAFDAWFRATSSIASELGITALGIRGAAFGTLLGTLVELLIPAAVFLSPRFHRLYGTRRDWRPSLRHLRELLKVGWPGALSFGNEMICWSLFMVYFVGQFGAAHSNAGWIAHQWMSISFMPTVGISIAATAIVGKYVGMKRPDVATKRAWLAVVVAVCWMTTMGVAFVVFRRQLVELFIDGRTSEESSALIIRLGMGFMLATAAFQFFDAIAMTLSGALRGAGDTVWPGVATLVTSWVVIVGGSSYAVARHPELSSQGPWIAASAYVIILSLLILWRFLGGAWKTKRLVREDAPQPPVPRSAIEG